MLADNKLILAYVFGIPLFLILVAVVMGWIKSIRKTGKKDKDDDISYIYKGGRLAGGKRGGKDEYI